MDTDESVNPWGKVSTRVVYDNPWINVREDEVVRPDGQPGIYGVVHFKNIAVGVLAVEDGEVYLVGQYRYTLERYSWEIVEGGCGEGEETLDAARRELEEETGLRASNWVIAKLSKLRMRCYLSAACKSDPATSLQYAWSKKEILIPLDDPQGQRI